MPPRARLDVDETFVRVNEAPQGHAFKLLGVDRPLLQPMRERDRAQGLALVVVGEEWLKRHGQREDVEPSATEHGVDPGVPDPEHHNLVPLPIEEVDDVGEDLIEPLADGGRVAGAVARGHDRLVVAAGVDTPIEVQSADAKGQLLLHGKLLVLQDALRCFHLGGVRQGHVPDGFRHPEVVGAAVVRAREGVLVKPQVAVVRRTVASLAV
mmetsp:Transcript_116798/g.335217  ORF Transcript_116798/g.335217 Transcript_116798/m.335217 type:complete len:210 (+) Transcript_116798:583-1212(+)